MMSNADFYQALDDLELTDATPLARALRGLGQKMESLFNIATTTSERLDRLEAAFNGRMDRTEAAIGGLLERSKPKAKCVLCRDEAQADGHSTAGCLPTGIT
ncbi:hypothetical protein Q1695_003704 [Nippostrongylus brasiliensis]|nr:hypothetical protein Q1695_003704 [Nippostrongylus brasiliensis]